MVGSCSGEWRLPSIGSMVSRHCHSVEHAKRTSGENTGLTTAGKGGREQVAEYRKRPRLDESRLPTAVVSTTMTRMALLLKRRPGSSGNGGSRAPAPPPVNWALRPHPSGQQPSAYGTLWHHETHCLAIVSKMRSWTSAVARQDVLTLNVGPLTSSHLAINFFCSSQNAAIAS